MCGRFTLRTPMNLLVQQFLFDAGPLPQPELELKPRYNVAPTQSSLVVRNNPKTGQREMAMLQWGLIPSWAKDTKVAYSTLNARAETLCEKPAFRTAFKKRRCLVVADGYYEWRKEGKKKLPVLYELPDHRPFAFAGLWESWWGPGHQAAEPLESFTVVTTSANDLARQVHDRMPVILDPVDYAAWLDPQVTDADKLEYLLQPYEGELMTTDVDPIVNNVKNDSPQCVAPLTA